MLFRPAYSLLIASAALAVAAPLRAETDKRIPFANGTGFYVSHDGYVLTANHVIQHCSNDITLHNNLMVIKAALVTADPASDLALLKIVPSLAIEHIAFLRPAQPPLKPGDTAVVAGYPIQSLNDSQFANFTTSDSKILSDKGPHGEEEWMLFKHVATPGYSGGPVLDAAGNIIGVTSASACISRDCSSQYNQAIAGMKKNEDVEQIQSLQATANQFSDANIATSIAAIRKFLGKSGVAYQEKKSDAAPSARQLAGIAESIVNIRCQVSPQDMREEKEIRVFPK